MFHLVLFHYTQTEKKAQLFYRAHDILHTMHDDPIIHISNYKMRFGDKTVIEDLSFDVNRGEIFGFLGANGSGKTTTLRTLLGIYDATKGKLLIDGKKFTPDMGSKLGYLPEERGLYKKESVMDIMIFFGQLKGLSKSDARKWSISYLERVELADKAGVKLEKLSGGQQQKIQLGITIINSPELLILDEPTKGFDPVNRRLMLDIIAEQNKAGATIMFVTHQMEEVERLCHRIVLLKDGARRAYGDIDTVKNEFGGLVIALRFNGILQPNNSLYAIAKKETRAAEVIPAEGISVQQILAHLVNDSALKLQGFEARRPSLDDIFVSIYEENRNKETADV